MRPSWFHLYGLVGVLSIGAPAPCVAVLAAGPDGAGRARTVTYSEHDVVGIQTRLRFTTVIVLPKTEQILDVVCGDKEFWPVSGALNIAYVKPAKARATSVWKESWAKTASPTAATRKTASRHGLFGWLKG